MIGWNSTRNIKPAFLPREGLVAFVLLTAALLATACTQAPDASAPDAKKTVEREKVAAPVAVVKKGVTIISGRTQLTRSTTRGSVVEPIKIVMTDSSGALLFNVPLSFSLVTAGSARAQISSMRESTNSKGEIDLTMTAEGVGGITLVVTGDGVTGSKLFDVN